MYAYALSRREPGRPSDFHKFAGVLLTLLPQAFYMFRLTGETFASSLAYFCHSGPELGEASGPDVAAVLTITAYFAIDRFFLV